MIAAGPKCHVFHPALLQAHWLCRPFLMCTLTCFLGLLFDTSTSLAGLAHRLLPGPPRRLTSPPCHFCSNRWHGHPAGPGAAWRVPPSHNGPLLSPHLYARPRGRLAPDRGVPAPEDYHRGAAVWTHHQASCTWRGHSHLPGENASKWAVWFALSRWHLFPPPSGRSCCTPPIATLSQT